MRQYLLFTFLLAGALRLHASDYKYLVLQQTDGTTIDMTASGLSLTFSGGNLIGSDGTSVSLASLSKMFFSLEPTGISEVLADGDSQVAVYSLTGAFVGRFSSCRQARQNLLPGVYVLKVNGETRKIAVR